jgi:hypothetical protein
MDGIAVYLISLEMSTDFIPCRAKHLEAKGHILSVIIAKKCRLHATIAPRRYAVDSEINHGPSALHPQALSPI